MRDESIDNDERVLSCQVDNSKHVACDMSVNDAIDEKCN